MDQVNAGLPYFFSQPMPYVVAGAASFIAIAAAVSGSIGQRRLKKALKREIEERDMTRERADALADMLDFVGEHRNANFIRRQ
tara:strand:+ start:449 stop:697 length:249 start_codon:yes stop_codon:yes gene_type:complete